MEAARFVPSANTILEVLNLHNYEDWSSRIKTYLEAEGLWDVVETKAETSKKKAGTEDRNWKKKNAKAHHAIKNSCGTDVFGFIRDSKTAKDAWATLAKMFKPVTTSNNTEDGYAGLQLKDLKINDVIEVEVEVEVDDHQQRNIYEPFFKYLEDGYSSTGFSYRDAREFLERHPETVRERHPSSGMPALHLALETWGKDELAKMIVQLMTAEDLLDILDPSGRTALSYALPLGDTRYIRMSVAVAKCMVKKNERLLSIMDPLTNMIPVVMAHAFGAYTVVQEAVASYLFSVTPLETMCVHQAAELMSVCLRKGKLEIPMRLLDLYDPSLGITKDLSGQSPLYTLADNILKWGWDREGRLFNGGEKRIFWKQWIYDSTNVPLKAPTLEDNYRDFSLFRGLVNNLSGYYRIRDLKILHVQVLTILDRICEVIRNKNVAEMQESSPLKAAIFRAAEKENVGFIRHMFSANKGVSEITNDRDKTVLQFAADYRLQIVYNLIHDLDDLHISAWDICSRRDKFDNNMLHIVGSFPSHAQARIGRIRGAALQMQREFQWYLATRLHSLGECSEVINQTDQLRPFALFNKCHKDLLKEAEMSMKDTATSCTVVGALIVTMMFAAAFTIPGGNNGDTGFPMFSKKKAFMIFIVSDAISLFSSTTSVMIFLGILTSRYKMSDFLKSLPSKMIAGLFTLFLSVATMMIAFTAALYMTLEGKPWIVVPVVLLSSVPIASFVWMQFPFFVEIFISTYGRKIPNKYSSCVKYNLALLLDLE